MNTRFLCSWLCLSIIMTIFMILATDIAICSDDGVTVGQVYYRKFTKPGDELTFYAHLSNTGTTNKQSYTAVILDQDAPAYGLYEEPVTFYLLDEGESKIISTTVSIPDDENEYKAAFYYLNRFTDEQLSLALLNYDLTISSTDTDNDGMIDPWEEFYGTDADTFDSNIDSDCDGLSNLNEFLQGTDPFSADSDNDGLYDGTEVAAGTIAMAPTIISNSSQDDYDLVTGEVYYRKFVKPSETVTFHVNITNTTTGARQFYNAILLDQNSTKYELYESPMHFDMLYVGTSITAPSTVTLPTDEASYHLSLIYIDRFTDMFITQSSWYPISISSKDTDGDGLIDPWEEFYGTNPSTDDADLDNDNDGLTNLQEFEQGTHPFIADSDNDGYSDGYEVSIGTLPLVPSPSFEMQNCTQPDASGNTSITWENTSYPNYEFSVYWTDSLSNTIWNKIDNPSFHINYIGTLTWTDTGAAPEMNGLKPSDVPARFYKVVLE